MPPQIRRVSLADDVYEAIKILIMDHTIAPGARVSIDALARDLEVSPTPVREALARLESDGLVRKRPMAGYTATPLLTRDEFEHLFDARLVFECAAAARAAQHRAVIDAELPDATGGRYAEHAPFTRADADFHHAVAAAGGNPLLHEAITRLHAHLHLHRLHFHQDRLAATVAEHAAIAAAIAAGDADRAQYAMHTHLLATRDRHRAYWADQR